MTSALMLSFEGPSPPIMSAPTTVPYRKSRSDPSGLKTWPANTPLRISPPGAALANPTSGMSMKLPFPAATLAQRPTAGREVFGMTPSLSRYSAPNVT
ncbi:hypothetical protein PIB19_12885 [Sphingomonas sp. 7/4-4]|uniref:hypothetical protein n=1 Tax=Sphingomonas sp. 7/4-4 TaxID=3018446 RepID=UPI0022F38794|nr:hypothetical protein [Sphingomonas sp. 7/4-4]WBY06489.1 hypothetical protein PIB19_12885 [Sphingomonas sp. 7/4-4]